MLAHSALAPAVEVSVLIVRAFVRLRGVLAANAELARSTSSASSSRNTGLPATHETAILKLLLKFDSSRLNPPSRNRFTADLEKKAEVAPFRRQVRAM